MPLTKHEIQILEEIHYVISLSVPQPVDITALLSRYHISLSTFNRAFKAYYKKTPAQHRINEMMAYAKKKIAEGYQIKVIARELGYSKTSNFSRAYKKVCGVLPSKSGP